MKSDFRAAIQRFGRLLGRPVAGALRHCCQLFHKPVEWQVGARRLLPRHRRWIPVAALPLVLAFSCGTGAMWVEPGSTASRMVFRIANTNRTGPPRVPMGTIAVNRCQSWSDIMWEIEPVRDSASVERVVYGVVPPGFRERTPPKPLDVGCYIAHVESGAETWFEVDSVGTVTEVSVEERARRRANAAHLP